MNKTTVEIPFFKDKIDHHKPICFLGSCFSENISQKFKIQGFYTAENPFGVIYNPASLAENMQAIFKAKANENNFFQKDGVFFSWDAHSKVYGESALSLKETLISKINDFAAKLEQAKFVFVTFGTAFCYERKGDLVGNCHKFPQQEFDKKLLSIEEIVDVWKPILEKLNSKNIIFTVSPVRHKKDGLIENTRSKSRLIEAVHQLCEVKNAFYFPSYEIVLDELRDYAYFGEDGVHPNHYAIKTIWNKVNDAFFSTETQAKANKFHQLYQDFQHKILFPESHSAKRFIEKRNEKLEHLKLENKDMNFEVLERRG